MQVAGNRLRKDLLVYRGLLFDYRNGYTYGPCFTLKMEAIEWVEKEVQRGDYPHDCQKMVMWNTCDREGEAPRLEGAKCDTII
ncbi:MAG: hypothetical protein JXR89_09795 [Deltaproteobacteria bacterium]|nr:hypothetical protein [Deltaproteobacteria bacterium]